MERNLKFGEADYYGFLAERLPLMLVERDGTITIAQPELTWEQRALLAESRLEALAKGLESEEAYMHMLGHNPIAAAIVTMGDNIRRRREHDRV